MTDQDSAFQISPHSHVFLGQDHERAERRTPSMVGFSQVEPEQMEPALIEPWFVSVQENADYDSKFLGVA